MSSFSTVNTVKHSHRQNLVWVCGTTKFLGVGTCGGEAVRTKCMFRPM